MLQSEVYVSTNICNYIHLCSQHQNLDISPFPTRATHDYSKATVPQRQHFSDLYTMDCYAWFVFHKKCNHTICMGLCINLFLWVDIWMIPVAYICITNYTKYGGM